MWRQFSDKRVYCKSHYNFLYFSKLLYLPYAHHIRVKFTLFQDRRFKKILRKADNSSCSRHSVTPDSLEPLRSVYASGKFPLILFEIPKFGDVIIANLLSLAFATFIWNMPIINFYVSYFLDTCCLCFFLRFSEFYKLLLFFD